MGRIGIIARTGLLGVLIIVSLLSCDNPLQNFIVNDLFGPPYRRQMARLVPNPNVGSYGFSVDISGDYMIVGEPNREGGKGGATIYHRTSGESWDAGTLIAAPAEALGPDATNGNDGDQYGVAVATDGNFAVIGSMYSGDATGAKRGRVAIYKREPTNGSWVFVSSFGLADLPSGATPEALGYDLFGNAISIDGSWMVIGARQDQNGVLNDNCGAVYLFQNIGGTWTYKEKHRAPVPQDGAAFGFSVDLSGDLLIVGSHNEDLEGIPVTNPFKQGAAYIYRFDTDNWQFSEKITAPIPEHMALFGVSVGISGDYAVVGSPTKTVDAVAQAGAIYLFQRSSLDDWLTIPVLELTVKNPVGGDWFGFSTAISGDHVLAGAFNRDDVGANAGAVYLYSRTGGNTWEQTDTIIASDAGDNGYFGMSVTMDATRAVVGATAPPPAASAGAVYVLK